MPQSVQLTDEQAKDAKTVEIIDALSRGVPYREIAQTHRVSMSTLSRMAQQLASIETEGVAKLMALKSLDALEHWERAMINGAKMGKHAPSRDWLIHAKAIKPVDSESGSGAKVAIIIGQPGQPVLLPSLQVIDGTVVSDETDE